MGRLQELLAELRDRQAADARADEARAADEWRNEGGSGVTELGQRVEDDSASRSTPPTSLGTTDSV